jgi:prolyl oligopeptidase
MQGDEKGNVIKCLLDPNKLREDGTASLRTYNISKNGKYLVYGVSYGGSDWFTIFVRDIKTGKDLDKDKIEWCKFSSIEFDYNCNGFYYNCYEPPSGMKDGEEGGTETAAAKNQMVKYHIIGEDPKNDELVYKTPDQPDWMFGTTVTKGDGKYLLITNNDSCNPVNRLYIHAVSDKKEDSSSGDVRKVVKAVDHLKAKWDYL